MRIVVKAAQRDSACSGDDGMSLIEVIVAIALIIFVLTATTVFFVGSMAGSSLQQQRQAAVSVAAAAMESTRAVPAKNLTDGRDAIRNAALRATAGSVNTSQSVPAFDVTATALSVPTVAFTSPPATVAGVDYTVRTFVDRCYLPTTGGVCGATQPAGSQPMYRVTVEVRWTPGRGVNCDGGQCQYVTSTLRDPSPDYKFTPAGG